MLNSEKAINHRDGLDYSKQDLFDFLRRHSGISSKCACNCPWTGNSIELLIKFVNFNNKVLNLSKRFQREACQLSKKLLKTGCPIGKSRLVLAASICYIVGITTRERRSQNELAIAFWVTETSIRINYSNIVRELNVEMVL